MAGIIILVFLFLLIGFLVTRDREAVDPARFIDRIDGLLPQTQCGQCGHPGCRPYAEAIFFNRAGINQCPPGGQKTITRLSLLLGRPVQPLNPAHGIEKPLQVARINEDLCIGCVKCIKACPVDAIIGASRQMHTVLTSLCTGCELCLAPCPMDCIDMVPATRQSSTVSCS